MAERYFLATQNRGYFLDNKKLTLWLEKESFHALREAADDTIRLFLYNPHTKKVFGVYGVEMSVNARSRDKRHAVHLVKTEAFRRGAFYQHQSSADDFSLYAISQKQARMLTQKLSIANDAYAPVYLSLRYERGRVQYRYIELLKRAVFLERTVPVRRAILDEIISGYQDLTRDSSFESLRSKEIAAIGSLLFHTIFTDADMQSVLTQTGNVFFLDLDTTMTSLPWETLFHKNCFLGDKSLFSYGFRKNTIDEGRPVHTKVRCAIIRIPSDDLPNAEDELRVLTKIVTESSNCECAIIERPLRYAEFHALLERHDIVHLITHGRKRKSKIVFDLGNGKEIGANTLRSFSNPPALFFANTCVAADSIDEESIVAALIRAGVSNVIAAHGSLADNTDLDFLTEFYQSLFAGTSVSVAFRNAVLLANRNTFLRYRFFGTHNAHLLRPPKH